MNSENEKENIKSEKDGKFIFDIVKDAYLRDTHSCLELKNLDSKKAWKELCEGEITWIWFKSFLLPENFHKLKMQFNIVKFLFSDPPQICFILLDAKYNRMLIKELNITFPLSIRFEFFIKSNKDQDNFIQHSKVLIEFNGLGPSSPNSWLLLNEQCLKNEADSLIVEIGNFK